MLLFSCAHVSNNTIVLRPSTHKGPFCLFAATSDGLIASLLISHRLMASQNLKNFFKSFHVLLLYSSHSVAWKCSAVLLSFVIWECKKRHMERITEISLPSLSGCVAAMNVEPSLIFTEPYRISETNTQAFGSVSVLLVLASNNDLVCVFILFARVMCIWVYVLFNQDRM